MALFIYYELLHNRGVSISGYAPHDVGPPLVVCHRSGQRCSRSSVPRGFDLLNDVPPFPVDPAAVAAAAAEGTSPSPQSCAWCAIGRSPTIVLPPCRAASPPLPREAVPSRCRREHRSRRRIPRILRRTASSSPLPPRASIPRRRE